MKTFKSFQIITEVYTKSDDHFEHAKLAGRASEEHQELSEHHRQEMANHDQFSKLHHIHKKLHEHHFALADAYADLNHHHKQASILARKK